MDTSADTLTVEAPRDPAQIAADALDVCERAGLLEQQGLRSIPADVTLRHALFELSRLARQLAELAQNVTSLGEGVPQPGDDEVLQPASRPSRDMMGMHLREEPIIRSARWPGRPIGEPASHVEIEEGLSRAVIGGIVRSWSRMEATSARYLIHAADGRERVYDAVEASAFVDAVFAAEVAWAMLRAEQRP